MASSICDYALEKDITRGQRQTGTQFFSHRIASTALPLVLLKFYDRFEDPHVRRCSKIIKATSRSIKKDSYPLKSMVRARKEKSRIPELGDSVANSAILKWSFGSSDNKVSEGLSRMALEEQQASILTTATQAARENSRLEPSHFADFDQQMQSTVAAKIQDNLQCQDTIQAIHTTSVPATTLLRAASSTALTKPKLPSAETILALPQSSISSAAWLMPKNAVWSILSRISMSIVG